MVEIIPRQKLEYPFWVQALFLGSIVFLLFVLAGFFLTFQLQSRAHKELQRIQGMLAQGTPAQELRLEQAVFRWRDKFNDFASLAAARSDARPLFEFLEAYTHPRVVFTTLSMEPKLATLELAGATQDFRTLQEQMLIFQNREEVAEVTLSNIVLGEKGRVLFHVSIALNP